MRFVVDPQEQRRAKTPHELFVINIFAFHLLLTPAAIALGIGRYALLLPLLLSGSVIAFIYWRARRAEQRDPWFVAAHWKLAFRRCRWLLAAYAATGAVMVLVWLLTMGMADAHTRDIMLTVFTRIAIMPTFLTLLVALVMEAGAINQASRGEVPDRLMKLLPEPAGLEVMSDDSQTGTA